MRATELEMLVRVASTRLAAATAAFDQKKAEIQSTSDRWSLACARVDDELEALRGAEKARDQLRQQTAVVEAMRRADHGVVVVTQKLAQARAYARTLQLELEELQREKAELIRVISRESSRHEHAELMSREARQARKSS